MYQDGNIAENGKKTIGIKLMLCLVLGVIPHIGYSLNTSNKCEGLYCPQDQVVLSGDYFKAVSVAAMDFQQVLQQKIHNTHSKLGLFLSDLRNYLILIDVESDGSILIDFHPKNFEDAPVKGGGASYKVSPETFKILEKEYSM
ncbi:hypothetical protein [Methylosarcina fibrata]|uniref:hypothetical protein n=1 Tax=Methylosarcina fibrata TaxID=105972 RepID=UPI00037505B7|nr:hypothetical protein [Methylosarcina fibrata]